MLGVVQYNADSILIEITIKAWLAFWPSPPRLEVYLKFLVWSLLLIQIGVCKLTLTKFFLQPSLRMHGNKHPGHSQLEKILALRNSVVCTASKALVSLEDSRHLTHQLGR